MGRRAGLRRRILAPAAYSSICRASFSPAPARSRMMWTRFRRSRTPPCKPPGQMGKTQKESIPAVSAPITAALYREQQPQAASHPLAQRRQKEPGTQGIEQYRDLITDGNEHHIERLWAAGTPSRDI